MAGWRRLRPERRDEAEQQKRRDGRSEMFLHAESFL